MKAGARTRRQTTLRQDSAQSAGRGNETWLEPRRGRDDALQPPPVYLTRREREVLALMCEGLSNKAIGRRLKIAPSTVKVHVSKILRVLNVSNRLQAVIQSRCWELADPPINHTDRLNGSARGHHR